jgi:hypothetical protein
MWAVLFAFAALCGKSALRADEPPPITFESTDVLAKVDAEVIEAGDVVLWALADYNKFKVEQERANQKRFTKAQKERAYRAALADQVMSLVKIKLLYLQARQRMPKDKFASLYAKMEMGFGDEALKVFMGKLKTPEELEKVIEPTGSSIERLKRNFVESQIAQHWFNEQVREDDIQVAHNDLLARYREKLGDYEYPAKARYEELVVKLSSHRNEFEARATLTALGDKIKKGAAWAEVAKKSQGATATDGGRQPWIGQGSHRSPVIDEALFSLPIGTVSPILKDDRAMYLIRVIERKPAGKTPLADVEAELSKELKEEQFVEMQTDYMKQLFASARIWNRFDESTAEKRSDSHRR